MDIAKHLSQESRRQKVWGQLSFPNDRLGSCVGHLVFNLRVYRFLEDNEKYNGIENGMQVRTFRSVSRPSEICTFVLWEKINIPDI